MAGERRAAGRKEAMRIAAVTVLAFLGLTAFAADEVSTFPSYVDTDICARLMLGPITPARIGCSQQTAKEKPETVLVRLRNNMVFTVNKPKMLESLVGQFAEVSGTIKVKAGTMKLEEAKAIDSKSISPDDRRLLDSSRASADPKIWEKVRHELAMMPYLTEFDFISFTMSGPEVVLTGWTVRQTNRDYAFNVARAPARPCSDTCRDTFGAAAPTSKSW
jgi:hypothetical protein